MRTAAKIMRVVDMEELKHREGAMEDMRERKRLMGIRWPSIP